ncbi:MAG: hypothetical protein JKY48_14630 [Flavobacteriales bacterium]|nr:hypothetical protein [Flavobacteriales bacterium]
MYLKKVLTFCFLLILFHSCKRTLTDDEIRDRIVGNWERELIVKGSLNFTPKTDSALFYTKGKKNFVSFSKRGIASKTGRKVNDLSYFVEDGFVMISPLESSDTMTQEIIFVNSKKLVLFEEKEDMKYYYSRFVY